MTLYLYQVGTIPIYPYLKPLATQSMSLDFGRSWRTPQIQATGSNTVHSYLKRGRNLSTPPTMSFSSTILPTKKYTQDSIMSSILSYAGQAGVPVILLRFEEAEDENAFCCDCVEWFITYGTITNVGRSSSYYSSQNPFLDQETPINIDLQLQSRWFALDPLEWFYLDKSAVPAKSFPSSGGPNPNSLSLPPDTLSHIRESKVFYRYPLNKIDSYDPSVWSIRWANSLSGVGSDFRPLGSVDVNSPVEKWNLPPVSLYAFTNVSTFVTQEDLAFIKIKVTGGFRHSQSDGFVEESYLDVYKLDQELSNAGYGGLQATDIIVTGLTSPAPGVIIRGGTILTNIVPSWIYFGEYPGELFIGYNNVYVYTENASAQFAYQHTFSRS